MSGFQAIKGWLVTETGLAKDALHIYVGLALLLGVAALFRWRIGGWRPWLVVVAAAAAGEAWDLRDSVHLQMPIDLWANWHDLWNTAFWPTVLTLVARTRLFAGSDEREQTLEQPAPIDSAVG